MKVSSVDFAGADVVTLPNGAYKAGFEDVNLDGLDDLVLHAIQDLNTRECVGPAMSAAAPVEHGVRCGRPQLALRRSTVAPPSPRTPSPATLPTGP